MTSDFEHIVFEDSYLLGWEKSTDKVVFNVELLLTAEHPLFAEYDDTTDHGCYKVGRIVVQHAHSVTGLPYDVHAMHWNNDTNEYDDIAEIDALDIIDKQEITIAADEMSIKAQGDSIGLEFD